MKVLFSGEMPLFPDWEKDRLCQIIADLSLDSKIENSTRNIEVARDGFEPGLLLQPHKRFGDRYDGANLFGINGHDLSEGGSATMLVRGKDGRKYQSSEIVIDGPTNSAEVIVGVLKNAQEIFRDVGYNDALEYLLLSGGHLDGLAEKPLDFGTVVSYYTPKSEVTDTLLAETKLFDNLEWIIALTGLARLKAVRNYRGGLFVGAECSLTVSGSEYVIADERVEEVDVRQLHHNLVLSGFVDKNNRTKITKTHVAIGLEGLKHVGGENLQKTKERYSQYAGNFAEPGTNSKYSKFTNMILEASAGFGH